MRAFLIATTLAGLSVAVTTPLWATCPRTGGEKTRRVLASLAFYPAAPWIYKRGQREVPLPAAGVRVRVSHDTGGAVAFTEGTFVSLDDANIRIRSLTGDTLGFPLKTARCLQVYRQHRALGATMGLLTGVFVGGVGGTLVGLLGAKAGPWAPAGGMVIGAAVGLAAGPAVGYRRGVSVWDVAWQRP